MNESRPDRPEQPDGPRSELLLPRGATSATQRSGDADEQADARSAAVEVAHRGPPAAWSEVPWRTIIGTLAVVAAAIAVFAVLYIAWRLVVLVAIAGFFAVVLAPPVRRLQSALHLRRGMAVGLMLIVVLAVLIGLLAVFLLPVRSQLVQVITDLPGTVQQASTGRGPLGDLVSRLRLEKIVADNQESLTKTAESMQGSLIDMVGTAIQVLLAVITVLVMTALFLSQSTSLAQTTSRLLPDKHRDAVVQVSRDAAKAVSGYMIGNLFISLCAGVAAMAFLLIAGVPSPIVVALFVAFADLIPLVGATIGAIVAVVASLSVSPQAGIAALIFFTLYQQFENSVLQLIVMSRTVKVNSLAVLLSVLIGVELFGIVGALLAIPIAGALSVVVKELWRHRASPADQLLLVSERGVELRAEDVRPVSDSSADE